MFDFFFTSFDNIIKTCEKKKKKKNIDRVDSRLMELSLEVLLQSRKTCVPSFKVKSQQAVFEIAAR